MKLFIFMVMKPFLFNGLFELKYLWIQHNRIQSLDIRLFNGLQNLKTINLDYNKISTIKPNTFDGRWLAIKIMDRDLITYDHDPFFGSRSRSIGKFMLIILNF